MFELTRDGFSVLVMGYTRKKADYHKMRCMLMFEDMAARIGTAPWRPSSVCSRVRHGGTRRKKSSCTEQLQLPELTGSDDSHNDPCPTG